MLLSMLLFLAAQGPSFTSPSCTPGQQWEFTLRGRDVDKSPRWTAADDAPPLAPRAAVRSARAFLGRMKCEQPDEWELHQVSLRPILAERDVWVYIVEFLHFRVPKDAVIGSASPSEARVVVLLDGTAIVPTVMPWPSRR
jgi:hypothetical protein